MTNTTSNTTNSTAVADTNVTLTDNATDSYGYYSPSETDNTTLDGAEPPVYDYYVAPVELTPDELAASLFDLPPAPEADPYAYYEDGASAETEMAAETNAILNIAAGDIAKYPNVAAAKLPGKVDVPEA